MPDDTDDVKDDEETPDAKPDVEFSDVAPSPSDSDKRAHHTAAVSDLDVVAAELLPLDDIVAEVLAGDWGEGKNRAHLLRSAGYPYLRVEAEVRRRQAA